MPPEKKKVLFHHKKNDERGLIFEVGGSVNVPFA